MGTWGTVNLIYLEHLVLNYVSRIECVNCYTSMGRKRSVAFENTMRFPRSKNSYCCATLWSNTVESRDASGFWNPLCVPNSQLQTSEMPCLYKKDLLKFTFFGTGIDY